MSLTPAAGFDPKANKTVKIGAPRRLRMRGSEIPLTRHSRQMAQRRSLLPCDAIAMCTSKDSLVPALVT